MDDNFDKELKEMASQSKVIVPEEIKMIARHVVSSERKSKRYKKLLAIASLITICILGSGGVLDVVANEGNTINSVLEFFIVKTNKIDDGYKDNTIEQNYSADSEGYSIIIEDTYYDGEKFELFYKVINKNGLDKSKIYYPNTKLDINADIDAIGGLEEKEFIDDNTFAGMISYGIASNSSGVWPEILEGFIKINEIIVYDEDYEKRIPINIKPLEIQLDSNNVSVEEFNINESVSYEGLRSEFRKIIKTPTGIVLEEIRDSSWLADTGYFFNSFLWDSKKGPLEYRNKTSEDSSGNIILKREYEKTGENSELAIVTFAQKSGPIGDGSYRNKTYTLEEGVTLDLNDLGEIYVEKIDYKDNETLITMKLKGYMALQDLDVINGNNRYLPSAIINKEVLDNLEMKATYIYPKMNRDLGINVSIFTPEYIKLLESQIINIKFD